MKDLLSVKEFSELSGIAASTLRYWDDIGLFSPQKRDTSNNYRYYSPDQLIAVNFISTLSSLNVPLKTISENIQRRTPQDVISIIEFQEKNLISEMHDLWKRYSIMITRRELIKSGMEVEFGINAGKHQVGVFTRDDKAIILGPLNTFKGDEKFYDAFARFYRQASDRFINLNFPIGGYHEDMSSFLKAPNQPTRFFSIDPAGNTHRKAGEYLCGFAKGYYGELGDLSRKMELYTRENAIQVSGPVYTIYLLDEVCIEDPSQYIVQVCVSVSSPRHR